MTGATKTDAGQARGPVLGLPDQVTTGPATLVEEGWIDGLAIASQGVVTDLAQLLDGAKGRAAR